MEFRGKALKDAVALVLSEDLFHIVQEQLAHTILPKVRINHMPCACVLDLNADSSDPMVQKARKRVPGLLQSHDYHACKPVFPVGVEAV